MLENAFRQRRHDTSCDVYSDVASDLQFVEGSDHTHRTCPRISDCGPHSSYSTGSMHAKTGHACS
jgi:hypothetical protein